MVRSWLVALFLPALALAAPRVVTLTVAGSGATVSDVLAADTALVEAMRKSAQVAPVSAAMLAREEDAALREVKASDAARLVAEARDALDNLKGKQAGELSQKAVTFAEASDLSASITPLLDAYAVRALAAFRANDKGEFGNDVQRLLVLDPDYVWDKGRLNPQVSAAIAQRKAKLAASGEVTLEVDTLPTGAQVWVDGKLRGPAPVTVGGLRPGSHVVSALLLGHQLEQQLVFAGSGKPTVLRMRPTALGKVLVQLAQSFSSGGALETAAGRLAQWADADEALVLVVSKPAAGFSVRLVRATLRGEKIEALSADGAGLAALVPPLVTKAMDAKGVAPPPTTRPAVEVSEAPVETLDASSGRDTRRTIGWVCFGVGLASAGAGLTLGLLSRGAVSSANALPQTDTAGYNAAAGRARTFAGAADVLFITSVVGVGVGLGLVIANRDTSDEEASLVPSLLPGGAGLVWSGRFP